MNLLYGEIIDLLCEDGLRLGKVRVGGAVKKIPLELLTDAARGDKVLLCDGVAIARVADHPPKEETDYVSGHPR